MEFLQPRLHTHIPQYIQNITPHHHMLARSLSLLCKSAPPLYLVRILEVGTRGSRESEVSDYFKIFFLRIGVFSFIFEIGLPRRIVANIKELL